MVLRVKANSARSASTDKRGTTRLLQSLQFLAGLEADRLAGRNGYFRAGTRVTSDASFARTHIENTESAKLDALTLRQRPLHAFENGFHGHLGFGFGNTGFIDDFVDDIELNQSVIRPLRLKALSPAVRNKANFMIGLGLIRCQDPPTRYRRFLRLSFARPAPIFAPA